MNSVKRIKPQSALALKQNSTMLQGLQRPIDRKPRDLLHSNRNETQAHLAIATLFADGRSSPLLQFSSRAGVCLDVEQRTKHGLVQSRLVIRRNEIASRVWADYYLDQFGYYVGISKPAHEWKFLFRSLVVRRSENGCGSLRG